MNVVVLPAYNCSETLAKTINQIPAGYIDDIVLVDDCSSDNTLVVAKELNIKHIICHSKNLGYGGNQKSCYSKALALGAEIIIMLHPDYQYDPKLIRERILKVQEGADIVLGSRMLKGKEAIRNGMPIYKYLSNRALTIFQNMFLKQNLSEYHTGYRAFRKGVLNNLNFSEFSDDFIFDNQILIGAIEKGYTINEVYCPAKYADDSSSINLRRSIKYGLLVIYYTFRYILKRK